MRKEFGELKDEDDGVIAYGDKDLQPFPKLCDKSLEQVIGEGLSKYDTKKDVERQNVRLPKILCRNINTIATRNGISKYKAMLFIMKRGNAEIEELLKGQDLSWTKQFITDTGLCLPGNIEQEALVNLVTVEWDLEILQGGKHTTVRMPWYVAGEKEEIERKMDMQPSDVTKLILSAGISRSEHCREIDRDKLKKVIQKVESVVLQQEIIINGVKSRLPEILKDCFLDPDIYKQYRVERFKELQNVISEASRYHQQEAEKFITTEITAALEEIKRELPTK